MKQPASPFVFHEQEVAGVLFHAAVKTGRVVLDMQNSSGRESSVDLIGEAFALPCLCYRRDGWQRRGMISGPPGWAVCHDTDREPRMFLGHLLCLSKINPTIIVVQSAEDWAAKNAPCPLHGAR